MAPAQAWRGVRARRAVSWRFALICPNAPECAVAHHVIAPMILLQSVSAFVFMERPLADGDAPPVAAVTRRQSPRSST